MADATGHDYDLELAGCTPEPLMAYLKALGILRLISEQKDSSARGWWKNDVFWLRSPVLFAPAVTSTEKSDKLINFFLHDYKPTPIVAPWNAGSGFFLRWDEKRKKFKSREASEALNKIERTKSERFRAYRDQLQAVKDFLREHGEPLNPGNEIVAIRDAGREQRWPERKITQEIKAFLDSRMLFQFNDGAYASDKSDKDGLLREMRNLLGDSALQWIDAALVLRTGQKKNRVEAPLLGSGGNIGNSDFSARFIQLLTSYLPANDQAPSPEGSEQLLRAALFGEVARDLTSIAIDQFDPGFAGGANMHQGMEGRSRLNPWDYMFLMEGAILLRGATSKRLASNGSDSSFPFTVASTGAGFASCGADEARAEQWLPLWDRACSLAEIMNLLAEGRTQIGSRSARSGVDFARAASSFGVDRGIKQFVRIQYQPRFGDNYLANPLGRFEVLRRESVDLLCEVDGWLEQVRSAGAAKDAPARLASVLRRVDSAIFDFCKYGGAGLFQKILIALGGIERSLALGAGKIGKREVRPLAALSADWATAADDQSREFAVARALASIHDLSGKIGPLRINVEPVDSKQRFGKWAEKDRAVVWGAADLTSNLFRVLERRIMDGGRAGCEHLPIAARHIVPLDLISAYLADELDDARISELIWGLMLVDSQAQVSAIPAVDRTPPLPRQYALLKLLFLPHPIIPERRGDEIRWRFARWDEAGLTIRPEPRILPLLRAGRAGESCRIAAHRLRISGLAPMPGVLPAGETRDALWSERGLGEKQAHRVAGALLLPLASGSVNQLVGLVCREQSAAAEALAISSMGESND